MIAVVDQVPLSFDEFLNWYPDASDVHYELRRGVILQMPKPKGKHSEITGFIIKKLNYSIDQMHHSWFVPSS